jgi:hypothetical protein
MRPHHALSSTSFGHPTHLVCCAPDDHSLPGQGTFSDGLMAMGRLLASTANVKGEEWDRIRSSYTNKFEHGLHREKGRHDNGGHDLAGNDLREHVNI